MKPQLSSQLSLFVVLFLFTGLQILKRGSENVPGKANHGEFFLVLTCAAICFFTVLYRVFITGWISAYYVILSNSESVIEPNKLRVM